MHQKEKKKAISIPSSIEELRYIIAFMFHPNKVRQVLTGFQSHQVLADFLNDEVGLLARHENKKQEEKLSTWILLPCTS